VWNFRTENLLGSEIQAAVDAIETFYDPLRSFMLASTVLTGPNEVVTDPLGAPTFDPVVGWSNTGGIGSGTSPQVLQLVAGWRTSSATRSGRGRTFVGPWASIAMDSDGTPSSSLMAAMASAISTLVSASTGANGWAIGVLSRTDGVIRDVVGGRARDSWSVLRSRRD
jgi:hypothetical protein